MEHIRDVRSEGWRMVLRMVFVIPLLSMAPLLIGADATFLFFWFLILVVVGILGICYAISNLRSDGSFVCRLTESDFSQFIPVSSCGDSFQIKLSEITQIEIHDGGGERPSDEWYIHTSNGRHHITTNYGNPHRKFGEAIQRSLPHIETIKT